MEPQKLMTHRKRKASKQFKSHFNAAIFKIPKIRKQDRNYPSKETAPEMVTHEQESIETASNNSADERNTVFFNKRNLDKRDRISPSKKPPPPTHRTQGQKSSETTGVRFTSNLDCHLLHLNLDHLHLFSFEICLCWVLVNLYIYQ